METIAASTPASIVQPETVTDVSIEKTSPAGTVSPTDVAKFEVAASDQSTTIDLTPTQSTASIKFETPGDVLLDGLEKARPLSTKEVFMNKLQTFVGQFQQQGKNINKLVAEIEPHTMLNMSELIKLQVAVQQYGLALDLFSKGADKVSQGVQTLFRNQG